MRQDKGLESLLYETEMACNKGMYYLRKRVKEKKAKFKFCTLTSAYHTGIGLGIRVSVQ